MYMRDLTLPNPAPRAQRMQQEISVWKQRGNDAYKLQKYGEAEDAYSEALRIHESVVQPTGIEFLYSNRAAARLKLHKYQAALQDAEAALAVDPKMLKAMFRAGSALMHLPQLGQAGVQRAAQLLSQAQEVDPGNQEVKTLLKQLALQCIPNPTTSLPREGTQQDQHGTVSKARHDKHKLDMSLLPASIRQGSVYMTSNDGVNENLLILLHGLGDTPQPYAALAKKLSLPQTACLALSGPVPVPETDGGRAWYTAFDEEWEPIQPHPSERRRTSSMTHSVALLTQLLDNLAQAGLWQRHQVSLFGFSQGGSAALHVHILNQGINALAGCVSIAGGLLEEFLASKESIPGLEPSHVPGESPRSSEGSADGQVKGCGPVIVTWGDRDDTTSRKCVDRTIQYLQQKCQCQAPQLLVVKGKGHAMLGPNQQEVRSVMEFWGKTLRAAAPVEGAVEIRS